MSLLTERIDASGPSIKRMTSSNLMRFIRATERVAAEFSASAYYVSPDLSWVKICSKNLIGSFSFDANSLI